MDGTGKVLPLIVGITGHIDILEKDKRRLREKVGELFESIKTTYPNTSIVMLNSLAPGADQLCAEVALSHGVSVTAVLPMLLEEYLKDFADNSAINSLITASSKIIVAPAFEAIPTNAPRGFFYKQAGHYIANNCHILLALWNGEEKLSLEGGGTYETIKFAKASLTENELYRERTTKVVQLVTPRASQSEKNDGIELYNLDDFNNQIKFNIMHKELKVLDSYNADHQKLIAKNIKIDLTKGFHSVFDGLALYYQRKTKTALQRFSLLGFALILSFLLYDEMEANLMLLVYGAALIVAGGMYITNKRKDYHQKYINYRALSENFRIQNIFETTGLTKNCYDCYNFAASYELDFVKTFVVASKSSANYCKEGSSKQQIVDWIEQQYQYHVETFRKKVVLTG